LIHAGGDVERGIHEAVIESYQAVRGGIPQEHKRLIVR
jgi:hypothetical protein